MKPPIKLLVVDADPEFRRYLTPLLHGEGYEVVEASAGSEGLCLARESKPDLVLLDMVLPDLSGLAICQQLKKEPSLAGAFVVLVSKNAVSWEDRSAGLSAGADECLAKPLALRDLLVWVRAMVRTQQKEKKLQASEQRFRALAERASDAIALLNEAGEYLYLSPSTSHILGYTGDGLLGRNAFELMHPDDRPAAWSAFNRLLEAPEGSETSGVRYRHKNGSWRWLDGVATNLLAEPSVRGIVINFRDITERVRAEERLRFQAAILSNVRESIIVTDRQGRILYWNDEATRIFGYSAEEMLGKTPLILYPDQSEEMFCSHLEASLRGQDQAAERRGRRKDGTDIWMDMRTTPMQDAQGRGAGIVGVSADVTERREAQAKINEYATRLQLLSRRLIEAQETERRSIARKIHDEIGQAILAVDMNLQAALRLSGGSEAVPLIQESIGILERVLRQAHDLALDLRPTMLDDLGLVPALRWFTNQQARRAALRVEFFADSLPSRLDPTIDTVCYRVGQEAVTNVVRHAKAQALSVQLLCEAEQLHLIVYDDGVGFDVKATRKSAWANAKLGLLGMEERVSLAGGRTEFKSAPGQGTEVHAWFSLLGSAEERDRNPS